MSGEVSQDGYLGQMDAVTQESYFNGLSFLVSQIVNNKWTIALVMVKAVKAGQEGAPPAVDVQPLVNQMDGYGQATPHGTIHGLPVFRLQGGEIGGVIADPVAGDIGVMACAMRDISVAVKTKKVANPGSGRTYDPADGLYIGSLLGKKLKQAIEFTAEGLSIYDQHGNKFVFGAEGPKVVPAAGKPFTVDGPLIVNQLLTAKNGMQIDGGISSVGGGTYAGNLHTTGTVTGDSDVVAGGKSLKAHTHPVTSAPGTTGPNN